MSDDIKNATSLPLTILSQFEKTHTTYTQEDNEEMYENKAEVLMANMMKVLEKQQEKIEKMNEKNDVTEE